MRLDAGPMVGVWVKTSGISPRIGAWVVSTAEWRESASELSWFEVLPASEAAYRAFTEVAA